MIKWFGVLTGILIFGYSFGQDTTRLKLLFVGDIMQHDSNIAAAFDPLSKKYDYTSCFEYVAPIIQSADLAIGNLELTLAGAPFKGYPQFSAPDELAIELKRIGFDVLVNANNHSVDRGRKGIQRTISVLDTLGLIHTGTFKDSVDRATNYPLIIEKDGFKLSFLNYTYGTNGIPIPSPVIVNLIDTTRIKNDLAQARLQNTDAIIVFLHWGNEYQSLPSKEQKKLAKLCFREGAKLVIGAHPHVLQPMEWNKEQDQFIVYSLGNFVSGQRPRYRDGGAMVWIDLEKVSNDSIVNTSIRNAEYEFVWVNKSNDARKEFTMMPLRYFETDTLFFTDSALRNAFEVFTQDSRKLYASNNLNVFERENRLDYDLKYSIRLGNYSDDWMLNNLNNVIELESLIKQSIDNKSLWYVGNYSDYFDADKALKEIKEKTEFKNARIVKVFGSAQ